MRRSLSVALFTALMGGAALFARADENPAREKLQELQDFIGTWEASGGPDGKKGSVKGNWKETLQWNWRFKGDDAWLNLEVKGGKVFEGGDLRWDAGKKAYVSTPNCRAAEPKPSRAASKRTSSRWSTSTRPPMNAPRSA